MAFAVISRQSGKARQARSTGGHVAFAQPRFAMVMKKPTLETLAIARLPKELADIERRNRKASVNEHAAPQPRFLNKGTLSAACRENRAFAEQIAPCQASMPLK